jgi:hypothetical protein
MLNSVCFSLAGLLLTAKAQTALKHQVLSTFIYTR